MLEQEKERRQGRLNAKKDYRQDLEDRQNDVYRKINSSATGIVDPLEGGDAIDQIVTVVPEGQGGFMQYVTDDNLDGLRGAEGQMTRLLEQGKFDAVVTGFVGEDGVLRHRIFEKGSVKTVETAEELNEEAARLKGGRVLSVFANGSDYIGGDNEGFSFNVTFRALKLSKDATVNDYMQGMSRKRDLVFADDDQGDDVKTDMVIISTDDKDSLTQRVKGNSKKEELKKTLAYIRSKSKDGSWYHAFREEERCDKDNVYDHLLQIAQQKGVEAAIEIWREAIGRDRALVYANRDQDIDAQSGQNDALGRGGKGRQGGSSRSATPQREGVGDSGSENLLSSDGSSKTSSRRSSTSDSAGPSSSSARSSRQVSVQTDRVISADSQSQSAPSRSSDAETSTTIASSSDITTQTSNSNSTSVHSQTTPVPSSGHGDHAPGRDAEPTRSGLQGSRSTSESFSDTSSEGARDAEGLRSEIDDLKDRLNRLMESFEDAVARFATFADHPNSSFLSDPSSHRAQADSSDRVDHHADHQREVGKGRFAQAAQAAQDFQKNLIEQFANERAVVARYQEALIQAHAREIEEARRLSQESQARADRSDERLQALLQSHKDEMANARNLTREERDVLTQQFDRERESAQRQSDQARQDHLNFQEILTQQLQKAREDSVRQANEADDRHALILERLMQHVESLRLPTDNALDQAANPPHPGQSGEVNAELTAQLTRLQEQLTALQGRFEESGQHNEALINLLRDSQRFANERSAGTDRRTDENNARQREEFNRRQTDLMDRHAREIQTLMEGFDRRATESEERFKALLQNHREEMARVSDMATEERRALTAQVQEARADATAARTEAANQAAQAADRQAALIRDFMQHMREMGIPVPAAPDQVVNPSNPTPAQVVNPDQPERPGDVNAGLMDRLTQLQAQLADLQRRFDQSAQMREEMERLREELRLLRERGGVPRNDVPGGVEAGGGEILPEGENGYGILQPPINNPGSDNTQPTVPVNPPVVPNSGPGSTEIITDPVSLSTPSPAPARVSASSSVELTEEQLTKVQNFVSGAANAVFKRDKDSRFSANGLLRSDEAQMQEGRERKIIIHLSEMLFTDDSAKRKELFSKRANASIIIEFARQISSDRELLTGTKFATAIFNSNNWKKHLSDSDLSEVATSSYDFIANSSEEFNLIKAALPIMKNNRNTALYNLVNGSDGLAGSAKKGVRTESFDYVKYNEKLKDVNSSVYFNGSERLASPRSGSASLVA